MPGSFFDTNVLIYLAVRNPLKVETAERLVAAGGTVSVQVLNEFASATRRKLNWQWHEIVSFLTSLRELVEVCPLTLSIHELGLSVAERHQLAIYDAMIVAAALDADCDVLYSEDMHDGLVVDGRLRVVNPFA